MSDTISTILTDRRLGRQCLLLCDLTLLREMLCRKANGVSSERQAGTKQQRRSARYFPAARKRGSSIGSQSSILLSSGSVHMKDTPPRPVTRFILSRPPSSCSHGSSTFSGCLFDFLRRSFRILRSFDPALSSCQRPATSFKDCC